MSAENVEKQMMAAIDRRYPKDQTELLPKAATPIVPTPPYPGQEVGQVWI